LPDAEEMRRETIITSVVDAKAEQVQRLPGSSFLPLAAALTTGGFFIFGTFHLWAPAIGSLVVALGIILYWLWTGTALIPEKSEKDVGLGLALPLYASGPSSIGYWAMFITMAADLTAFISIVFGYFYFWTIHEDFPPPGITGPGVFWPLCAALLVGGAWGLTSWSRRLNRRGAARGFYLALGGGVLLALFGGAALVAGPWQTGLDPTTSSYAATVWLLMIWSALHVGLGVIMQLYCLVRRWAGRLTQRHDMEIGNVALYWHFAWFMVAVSVLVGAGFPLVAEAGVW
jgi:cytochrome c oxidase subunit I+III